MSKEALTVLETLRQNGIQPSMPLLGACLSRILPGFESIDLATDRPDRYQGPVFDPVAEKAYVKTMLDNRFDVRYLLDLLEHWTDDSDIAPFAQEKMVRHIRGGSHFLPASMQDLVDVVAFCLKERRDSEDALFSAAQTAILNRIKGNDGSKQAREALAAFSTVPNAPKYLTAQLTMKAASQDPPPEKKKRFKQGWFAPPP